MLDYLEERDDAELPAARYQLVIEAQIGNIGFVPACLRLCDIVSGEIDAGRLVPLPGKLVQKLTGGTADIENGLFL